MALAASTALSAAADAAWAQAAGTTQGQPAPETPVATKAGSPPPPVLSEIVVTADRKNSFSADYVQAGSFRGARNLDTPLTVSVIPEELIQAQQARGLLDALRNTAGVTQAQTTTVVYNNLSIRGIAVDNRENYRLDGSLPILNLVDLPLEDKDRVEALKGASALYYGFTTPSGIINMVMKRPTAEPMLEVDAFGNDHGEIGGHFDASGRYGMFGARINGVYADVDSGIKDTLGQRSLISGAFDFKPTRKLTVTVDYEHIEKTVNEPGIFLLTAPKSTIGDLYPRIALPPLLDPSTNFGASWGINHAQETNVLANATYKINNAWSVTIAGGDSYLERTRHFQTLTPTNLKTGDGTLSIGLQDTRYENRNLRGEIAGTFYTGPFLHEILFGASDNLKDSWAPGSQKADCMGGVTKTPGAACDQNFFTPRAIPTVTSIPREIADTTRIADIGYYAFDRVEFQKWLQLLGGVRYSDYTESDVTTGKDTFHATPTSYSWGVVVKPRSWASIYGTYIEGLETTPAAPTTAANAGQQLPATFSTQYEAGVKLEPRKGLLFQAAWFDINRGSTYVNSATNLYIQDGRADYTGEELSLTGEVNKNLSVYLSALFLDARQTSGAPTTYTYVNSKKQTVVQTTPTAPTGYTFSSVSPTVVGNVIENTPKTTLSAATEYRFRNWLPGFSVNGGVYYVGKRAINALNEAFIPGYTTVDLGASYQTEIYKHPTTFRLNAQNLANTRYWAATGSMYLSEGAPQTIEMSVSSKF